MPSALRFLRSQIAEIERDDALRWYGVAMAFLHVVTYLFWVDQRIVAFVNAQAEPICWPLVPACEELRVLSAPGVALLLRAYFAAAIGAGFLFASRRLVPWGYAGLLLVNGLKLPFPLLMFAILAIFPLSRLVEPRDPPDGLLIALWKGRELRAVYALAALFSLLQLIPYGFPGDRTLTGQGRLYALHMFDARATCAGWAELHNADGTTTRRDLKLPLDTRVACDPIVYFNRARNLCRQRDAGRAAFEDLDLFLSARRASDGEMKRVIATKGFCAKGERYDPFRHNAWILTE